MATQFAAKRTHSTPTKRGSGYAPPDSQFVLSLRAALAMSGKPDMDKNRYDLFSSAPSALKDLDIFAAGDKSLLCNSTVAIVGTREATEDGIKRAGRLARELVFSGVTVASGLARGIDAAAHASAIENGGNTIAVIGTPLNKAYPAENARLQEEIWRDHLLLSPFKNGEAVFKGNFPKRNRVMAAISDATVIIEASDTSGTLHQAAECLALGRWLFIAQSVVSDSRLKWPAKFIGRPKVVALKETSDILNAIRNPADDVLRLSY